MRVIDGHSHMYQTRAPSNKRKKSIKDLENFNIDMLIKGLDELGVSQIQMMPQVLHRIQGEWIGSNELSAEVQQYAPERIIAFASAEPLDVHSAFNRAGLNEVVKGVVENGLKGLSLSPPYGHFHSNDRRVYPYYERSLDLNIPVYLHSAQMYTKDSPDCPRTLKCPLQYSRIWLLEDVAIDFPELRFNAEHMGYPWEEELFAMMVNHPNVYTDIALFIEPYQGKSRRLLLARDLATAREYGVLDRVIYGSDYSGDNVDEYMYYLRTEITYIKENLNSDMRRLGYSPLSKAETESLLSGNILALLGIK